MAGILRNMLGRFGNGLAPAVSASDLLFSALALALAGQWFGPRGAAIVALIALPAVALRRLDDARRSRRLQALAVPMGIVADARAEIAARLDAGLSAGLPLGKAPSCLAVAVDDPAEIEARWGPAMLATVSQHMTDRIAGVLREGDLVCPLGAGRHAIALAPARRTDLESAIAMATRLRAALGEPFSLQATTVPVSASVGFSLPTRAPARTGAALLAAAEAALDHAQTQGAGNIRAWSEDIARSAAAGALLRQSSATALDRGEIVAWFQPQLCTDTGAVTGFEALARWDHPTLGILPPARFLPALTEAGLSRRLGEVMLFQALAALRAWDRAALSLPGVSVNFAEDDLRDPMLVERVKWELDRFDIAPGRLSVEVLETVMVGAPDDLVARNIRALARLGCGIDLDDFGTANASVAALRRFAVSRLKIDRSLVAGVDTSAEQRRIVSAILSMAGPLDLQVLAEGVETPGEHAMLAQLGCSHVQGFAIARPMPLADTFAWIAAHRLRAPAGIAQGLRSG